MTFVSQAFRKAAFATAITASFSAVATSAHAAPGVPLTPDMQLENSTDFTLLSQAARDAAGDTALLFFDGATGTNYLQTFHPDGTPYSPRVAFAPGGTETVVAMDAAGDVTLAWSQPDFTSGLSFQLLAQQFALDGTAKGNPIAVTPSTKNIGPAAVSVAMDDDGDFAVKWVKDKALIIPIGPGGYSYFSLEGASIYMRLYKNDGTQRTGAIRVETDAPSTNRLLKADDASSSLAMDAAGNITIAWTPYFGTAASKPTSINVRRYDVTGHALGTTFTVASSSNHQLIRPVAVADAAGDFAIGWINAANVNETTELNDINVQRYSANGTATGAPLAITQQEGTLTVSLSMDRAGDLAVQWDTDILTGNNRVGTLYAQYYGADGSLLAPMFTVNAGSYQDVSPNQVLLDGNGGMLSLWTGATPEAGGPGSNINIFGRYFSGPN